MVYEIWDLESGNAVGDFESEEAALSEVRAMVEKYGADSLIPWALGRYDGNAIVAVAEGERLISLALGAVQSAADSPPRNDAPPTGRRTARFEVYRDPKGEYRWRLKGRDGRTIASSGDGYTSRAGARNGIRSVKANAPTSEVTDS